MQITKLSKSKSEIIYSPKGLTEISTNYQPKILQNILIKNPDFVNSKDKKNETLLSYAIKRKNQEICELLISSPKLNLLYQDFNGNSYLHLSIINQLISITELLIQKGININLQNKEGNTALHYAYKLNNEKLISILIENNADTNIKNNNGLIPEQITINSLNIDINLKSDDILNKSYYNYQDKNKSILMNIYENNNTFNNTNNTNLNETNKISYKNSFVNYSYSEDEDIIEQEDKKEESDIFKITQSSKYKDKIKDVSNKNSHTIGDRYNMIPDFNDNKITNKNNNINKSKNDNAFCEYSTSISKEEKDLQIQKPYFNNIINKNNKKNQINVNHEDNANNNKDNKSFYEIKNLESKNFYSFDTFKESKNYQANNFIGNKPKDISNDSLSTFLWEINLDKKYYDLMDSNGFEDIHFLIGQERSNSSLNTSITNSELTEIGIILPGDRAKILIHLEEKAGNFSFTVPREVYYNRDNLKNFMEDENIQKIYNWLKMIKVENYLENFLEGGYYSVELILMQMNSKNPITDIIIKDELGIKKVGHRARIINKLVEDGKKFLIKMREKVVNIGNGQTDRNCDCIIF